MKDITSRLMLLFSACRGYSTPTSIMSCLIPFLFGLTNSGNFWYGTLAFLGVLAVHLATNIFDDAIDYHREKIQIDKGIKETFNFQMGKCGYILDGKISLKSSYFIAFALFFTGLIIGLFFIHIWGLKLLWIIVPTALLCLLYPILGSLGFGELIVGTIYSVLLYSGMYFIMTGNFSLNLLLLSISTGLIVVGVLFNHMLLDYKIDTTNRKITLCRLCKSENKALIVLGAIELLAYINIIILVISQKLHPIYLITLLSLPYVYALIKGMKTHIKNPDEEVNFKLFMLSDLFKNKINVDERSFIIKFLLSENILCSFTILLCIAIISDKLCIL